MEKHCVVIRKEWPDREIRIKVVRGDEGLKEISLAMDLRDFIAALATETGSPLWLLTPSQLLAKLQHSAESVCEKMKSETRRIM